MKPQNDPIRLRHAYTRVIAAVLAAVILLAIPGFATFKLLRGGKTFDVIEDVQPGDYVERDICIILDYFASGYNKSGSVTEKYAVVPINGQMVAFRFPARWLASADTIQSNTLAVLYGTSSSLDQYIRVSGTVKAMSEDVATQLYSWFGQNKDWMTQAGMIQEVEDYADYLPDVVVSVDTVGYLPGGWVAAFSIAAALCLIYAIVVLIRIACKKYAAPDILVEITEEPAGDTSEITEETPSPDSAAAEPSETIAEAPADESEPDAPSETTAAEAAEETEPERREEPSENA